MSKEGQELLHHHYNIGGLSNMLENMDLHFLTPGVVHCALE